MPHVEWDATLETGDAVVDAQHQKLIALFNQLIAADVADDSKLVMQALEELTAYVAVHFTCEESLMAECEYPAERRSAHLAEHRDLTAKTRGIVLDYRSGKITSVQPIVGFLTDWLAEHINGSDRALVEWVTESRGRQQEAR